MRERFPLPRLRENWKRLAEIHARIPIEMWANCENFTWERGTNDRTSALVPAAPERFVAQLEAASDAGVDRIVSFMMCGIFEMEGSLYPLGQPELSVRAAREYMAWKQSCAPLRVDPESGVAIAFCSEMRLVDGAMAEEDVAHKGWVVLPKGKSELSLVLAQAHDSVEVHLGMLNYAPKGVALPEKIALYGSADGESFGLLAEVSPENWSNNRHDAWIKEVVLSGYQQGLRHLRLEITSPTECYADEVVVISK